MGSGDKTSYRASFGCGNVQFLLGTMYHVCVSFHTVGGRDAEIGSTVLEADPQRKYTHSTVRNLKCLLPKAGFFFVMSLVECLPR